MLTNPRCPANVYGCSGHCDKCKRPYSAILCYGPQCYCNQQQPKKEPPKPEPKDPVG